MHQVLVGRSLAPFGGTCFATVKKVWIFAYLWKNQNMLLPFAHICKKYLRFNGLQRWWSCVGTCRKIRMRQIWSKWVVFLTSKCPGPLRFSGFFAQYLYLAFSDCLLNSFADRDAPISHHNCVLAYTWKCDWYKPKLPKSTLIFVLPIIQDGFLQDKIFVILSCLHLYF